MMGQIHNTAVVSPRAEIGTGVSIGPYAIIDDEAQIGDGTKIGPHVVIGRWTQLGKRNVVHAGAVLGTESQDLKFKGERSFCIIGDDNVIREFVTINRSSTQDGTTLVGDGNVIQTYSHIAHDCVVGNRVMISMHSTLAGHVHIEDEAMLEDYVGVHQFCRIGTRALLGTESKVTKDVPPYIRASGTPIAVKGLHEEGLERGDLSPAAITALRQTFEIFDHPGKNLSQVVEEIRLRVEMLPEIMHFIEFLQTSRRGICRKTRGDDEGDSELD